MHSALLNMMKPMRRVSYGKAAARKATRTRAPYVAGAIAALVAGPLSPVLGGSATPAPQDSWWQAGVPREMPSTVQYADATGLVAILNTGGAFQTAQHPFFKPAGSNGRACVTCHQPANGMGVSVDALRQRWEQKHEHDPVFAAIDGSNCPTLPQNERSSHSLLLDRGLFRIYLPWPPRRPDGSSVKPEFSLEVVSDPTGCNTDPAYGLASPHPTVSVYRRPRPVANLKYLLELPHGVPPHEYLFYNDKSLLPDNPETGGFSSLQLMSDGRDLTLKVQAQDAAKSHLQVPGALNKAQLAQIESFEHQIYAGQGVDFVAGDLTQPGSPPGLGPKALATGSPASLGNNPINRIFGSFVMWQKDTAPDSSTDSPERRERRRSVARGADIFYTRRFLISDVGRYNDKGLGNPFKRSCGGGCHNTLLMGMDLAPGYMDLGLNNLPWANNRPDLPLFKVVCDPSAPAQSYLGRVIYTHDPARALITGKCVDVGASMTQQSRGLAARAPYFMNGSAANLRELVDFYDRRFNIGYSETEKSDLVNFLATL